MKEQSTMMLNAEQKVLQLINQYRASSNLPILELDERISQLAREHSEAMANSRIPFGNYRFKERIRKISMFLPNAKAAENVASYRGNPVSEELIFQFWLKSHKHRKSIQGDFHLTGIGVAKKGDEIYYFTQIFIKKLE